MTASTNALEAMLHDFCGRIAGIKFAVIAAIDGFPIAHTLPPALHDGTDPEGAAAMVAATLGLGQRLVALVGDAELQETTMRSEQGYVLSFAIGRDAVLTVLAGANVNVAHVGIAARELVGVLVNTPRDAHA